MAIESNPINVVNFENGWLGFLGRGRNDLLNEKSQFFTPPFKPIFGLIEKSFLLIKNPNSLL